MGPTGGSHFLFFSSSLSFLSPSSLSLFLASSTAHSGRERDRRGRRRPAGGGAAERAARAGGKAAARRAGSGGAAQRVARPGRRCSAARWRGARGPSHVWGGGRSGAAAAAWPGWAPAGRRLGGAAPAVAQRAAGGGLAPARLARHGPEVAVRWPERRPAGWSSRLLGRGGTAERRPKRLTARPDDGRGGVPGGLAERWPNGSRRHRRGSAEARSAGAVASGTAASVEWRLGRFAGVGIWLGG